MAGSPQRQPRPAYLEDYNEDDNTAVPGTRRNATANVRAKRRPDILKLKIPGQYEASDSGYSSQTAATAGTGHSHTQTSKTIVNQSNPEPTQTTHTMMPHTALDKGMEKPKSEKKTSIPSYIRNKLSGGKKGKSNDCDCKECAENLRSSRPPVPATAIAKSVNVRSASIPRQPLPPQRPSSPLKKAVPNPRPQGASATIRIQPPTQSRPENIHSYPERRPISVHGASPTYTYQYQTSYPVVQPHHPAHHYSTYLPTPTTLAHERSVQYPVDSYFEGQPSQVQSGPYIQPQFQPQPQPQPQPWPTHSYPQSHRRRAATIYNTMPSAALYEDLYIAQANHQNPQSTVRRQSVHKDSEVHYRTDRARDEDHPPRRRLSIQHQSRPPHIHSATTPATVPTLHHPRTVHYDNDLPHERNLRKQSLEESRLASRPALAPKRNSTLAAVAVASTKQRAPIIVPRDPSPVKRHTSRPVSYHETTGGLDEEKTLRAAEAYQNDQTKKRGIAPVRHPTIDDTKKKNRKSQMHHGGVSEAGSRNSGSSEGKNKSGASTFRPRRESDMKSRRGENAEEEGIDLRLPAGQSIQLEFKGNTWSNKSIEFKPSPDGDGQVQLMIGGNGQSRTTKRYNSVVSSGSRRGRSGTSRDPNYRDEPISRVGRDMSKVKEDKEEREVRAEKEVKRTRDEGTSTVETSPINKTEHEGGPEEERSNRFQSSNRRRTISHSVPSRVDRIRAEKGPF